MSLKSCVSDVSLNVHTVNMFVVVCILYVDRKTPEERNVSKLIMAGYWEERKQCDTIGKLGMSRSAELMTCQKNVHIDIM